MSKSDKDNKKYKDIPEADKKKAKELCWWSLGCGLWPLWGVLPVLVFLKLDIDQAASFVEGISPLVFLAGFILMIYIRAKYPFSKFGKGLMIYYIVTIVIGIISFVIATIVLAYLCGSCIDVCGDTLINCGKIG